MGENNISHAFIRLGKLLTRFSDQWPDDPNLWHSDDPHWQILYSAAASTLASNPWFILPNIRYALKAIGRSLEETQVMHFMDVYHKKKGRRTAVRNIGVVMAGNLPLVGFHDFFCVLASGHRFVGKLSSDDEYLLPAIASVLGSWSPGLVDRIAFVKDRLTGFDAVIATGSNNSARYFEYYFGKYPHLIRRNRHGVAVLTGKEQNEELIALGDDVFVHFGRGCRNVSKLLLPSGYPPERLFAFWDKYATLADHHKYRNNYDYYKSIYLVIAQDFHDSGFVLLKEETALGSPVAVLFYEYYTGREDLLSRLENHRDSIQCIVSTDPVLKGSVHFGDSQRPSLLDFADGIDTMEFLGSLHR